MIPSSVGLAGPGVNPNALKNPKYVGGFSSPHPAGANFAFGDGSVRFICEMISPPTFKLFGNRADGQMIDESQW
jgi:prepilin-type processing-associated H-X9-DG protein